jgi:protein gp37
MSKIEWTDENCCTMQISTSSIPDPFHPDITDESLDQFMATVALNPHITYQVLTKRTERMYEYFNRAECKDCVEYAARWILPEWESRQEGFDLTKWPLPNLHLGVSVENQAAADERIPWLLKTPAAKRVLSVEPLLEQITLTMLHHAGITNIDCLNGRHGLAYPLQGHGEKIDQIIVGGESGPGARPFHLEWARSLQQQCEYSGTAFFLKQVGSNPFLDGEPLKLKDRKGGDISEWPEDLQVRELI